MSIDDFKQQTRQCQTVAQLTSLFNGSWMLLAGDQQQKLLAFSEWCARREELLAAELTNSTS